ncbi:MAG: MaoC/PaaZ C-terminal domain-containing protein [Bacteroidota bacterium]
MHLDEVFAANTIFKRRIMHGMLSASIFSKVFCNLFPCEGNIYRNILSLENF